jgi:hypothetical protein
VERSQSRKKRSEQRGKKDDNLVNCKGRREEKLMRARDENKRGGIRE